MGSSFCRNVNAELCMGRKPSSQTEYSPRLRGGLHLGTWMLSKEVLSVNGLPYL